MPVCSVSPPDACAVPPTRHCRSERRKRRLRGRREQPHARRPEAQRHEGVDPASQTPAHAHRPRGREQHCVGAEHGERRQPVQRDDDENERERRVVDLTDADGDDREPGEDGLRVDEVQERAAAEGGTARRARRRIASEPNRADRPTTCQLPRLTSVNAQDRKRDDGPPNAQSSQRTCANRLITSPIGCPARRVSADDHRAGLHLGAGLRRVASKRKADDRSGPWQRSRIVLRPDGDHRDRPFAYPGDAAGRLSDQPETSDMSWRNDHSKQCDLDPHQCICMDDANSIDGGRGIDAD